MPWIALLLMYLDGGNFKCGWNTWIGPVGIFLWVGEFRALCDFCPAFGDIHWNFIGIMILSTVGWFSTWLILLGGSMMLTPVIRRHHKSRGREQDA